MSELIAPLAQLCATIIEVLGIGIITLIALYGFLRAGLRFFGKTEKEIVYQELRLLLGRGILVGLEFLIAADIIHTVAVDLNFINVGVLGMVILIRTFLSFTLEVELTGKWPWQENASGRF